MIENDSSFSNKTLVEVDIKDCNVDLNLLYSIRKPVKIFNNEDYIYESLEYRFNPLALFSIWGVIGYSITEQKFILEPSFLSLSHNKTEEILRLFWEKKINQCFFKQFCLFALIGGILYYGVWKAFISIYKRYKKQSEGISRDDLNYFKSLPVYKARGSAALNCEVCNTNSANIIY